MKKAMDYTGSKSISRWIGFVLFISLFLAFQAPFALQAAPTAEVTLPYIQDFENAIPGDPGTLPPFWINIVENFSGNGCIGDIKNCFDWVVRQGPTPTNNTGPIVDHTLGTATGTYVYVEASDNGHLNSPVEMWSPSVDLTGTGSPELSFWVHRGVNLGDGPHELHIDILNSDGTAIIADDVLIIDGTARDQTFWINYKIDLTPYIPNGEIRILFERTSTASESRLDIAVDDVTIHDKAVVLGSRVWEDADGDGIQDGGELGISGVEVTLHDMDNAGNQIGLATTDGAGNYLFGGVTNANMSGGNAVELNKNYEIRVADSQFGGLNLTARNTGGETDNNPNTDINDSDATLVGSYAAIAYATGNIGFNNNGLDFGLTAVPATVDYGDLPDDFGTTMSQNGAAHTISSAMFLGNCVDAETNGQPSADAAGDNDSISGPVTGTCVGNSDEDGIIISGDLLSGQGLAVCTTVTVNVTGVVPGGSSGILNAWVDWNDDGDFNDSVGGVPEQIVLDNAIPAAVTGGSADSLSFVAGSSTADSFDMVVPCATNLIGNQVGMRFRFSSTAGLASTGLAADGEVEDYRLPIYGWDFADAPDNDSGYPANQTVMVNVTDYSHNNAGEGARHILADNLRLGACVDGENDGVPAAATSNPLGDDAAVGIVTAGVCAGSDDEDGYLGYGGDDNWNDGGTVEVAVNGVDGNACVHGWVDWEANGFGIGSDSTAVVQVDTNGSALLNFPDDANMPDSGSFPSTAYLRLRVVPGTCGSLQATGAAVGGEVEDYQLGFGPTAVSLNQLSAVSSNNIVWVILAALLLAVPTLFVMRRQ